MAVEPSAPKLVVHFCVLYCPDCPTCRESGGVFCSVPSALPLDVLGNDTTHALRCESSQGRGRELSRSSVGHVFRLDLRWSHGAALDFDILGGWTLLSGSRLEDLSCPSAAYGSEYDKSSSVFHRKCCYFSPRGKIALSRTFPSVSARTLESAFFPRVFHGLSSPLQKVRRSPGTTS